MLQQKIKDNIKKALKARDEVRLTTLRGLSSAFTNELVAQKRKPDEELEDTDALTVIKRAAKQRKDSIEQFEKGGRDDLIAREKTELAILEEYLPQQASLDDIEKVVRKKIGELGASDKSQMGTLMGAVMKELGGNADGNDVKTVVERLLS